MSTTTTDTQLKTVANRLRSYLASGAGVNSYSAKVYPWFAAPDAALPNIVLVKRASRSDPDFHHLREAFGVDAIITGRARKDEPLVNALADLVQTAFPMWTDATSGLLFYTGYDRGEMEYRTDDQGQELIELRVVVEFAMWPVLTTSLT
jgi:hypothetical protein